MTTGNSRLNTMMSQRFKKMIEPKNQPFGQLWDQLRVQLLDQLRAQLLVQLRNQLEGQLGVGVDP